MLTGESMPVCEPNRLRGVHQAIGIEREISGARAFSTPVSWGAAPGEVGGEVGSECQIRPTSIAKNGYAEFMYTAADCVGAATKSPAVFLAGITTFELEYAFP
jgi:hypothetical protein